MIPGLRMDGFEHVETVIIGGGQAGLATGYQLATRGLPFVILDANERIGDGWRKRWDSLRLFTPARYDGLPGWPFPALAWSFPSKDDVARYLEACLDWLANLEDTVGSEVLLNHAPNNIPPRVHMRDPSFVNLQTMPAMSECGMVADVIAAVASIDPVMGGVDR